MFILQETTYAFLLVALVSIASLSLTKLLEILDIGQLHFKREYQLRRCGRFHAMKANLQSSIAVIHYYRPQLSQSITARLAAAVRNFVANYPAGNCTDRMLGLQAEIYRQANDQLPDFWPNYAVKFFRLP